MTNVNTPRDPHGIGPRILAFILDHPAGVKRSEILNALGIKKTRFKVHADRLAEENAVVRAGSGPQTLWGPPGFVVALKRVRSAQYHRDQALRNERRKRAQAEILESPGWEERAPFQSVVSASVAPPLRKLGPASVFELGAHL